MVTGIVFGAETCGGGSVTVLRGFHLVIEANRDIRGSIVSPSWH